MPGFFFPSIFAQHDIWGGTIYFSNNSNVRWITFRLDLSLLATICTIAKAFINFLDIACCLLVDEIPKSIFFRVYCNAFDISVVV